MLWLAASPPAQAHVRWFTRLADDVTLPLPLTTVLTASNFLVLFLLTLAVMAVVARVDARLGRAVARAALPARIDGIMAALAAPALRIGLALYFAAIAWYFRTAPIILTPELAAPGRWVVPLQFAIAVALLVPAGVLPACAGMVLLYLFAAATHGVAHLLDYHLFLGVCAFLALDRIAPRRAAGLGLAVLRVTVAGSFLWVGIEKWLYPQWTQDVLEHQFPALLAHVDPALCTMGAAFVEVALAFLMLFGRASSHVAAGALFLLMAGAIPLVGAVDAIGHLPMLFALFILATTRNRFLRAVEARAPGERADLWVDFVIVTCGVAGLYFLAHALAPAAIGQLAGREVALAMLWVGVLSGWVAHALHRGAGHAHTVMSNWSR